MLKLWPFNKKTAEPYVVPQEHSIQQKLVIDDDEYHRNFHETEDFLIEFASRHDSADSEFRRDFIDLAKELCALDHPGLLRLYSHGEDEGRLYRMWANRQIRYAPSVFIEDFHECCHQLAQVVGGFQVLHGLGLNINYYGLDSISFDWGGLVGETEQRFAKRY